MKLDDSYTKLLNKFLYLSGWHIDLEYAGKLLLSHPSFPSLASFSETLDYFNIPHEAYKTDYDSLLQIKLPALLHLNVHGGIFMLLLSISKMGVILYAPETGKKLKISKKEFIKRWTGVVLVLKRQQHILWEERISFINLFVVFEAVIVCVLGYFYFSFETNSIALFLLLVINIIGIILSGFIIAHELGIRSKISHEICNLTKNTDCDVVLSSPASKIFKIISLGDIGLIYFLGNLFILLLSPLLKQSESYVNLLFCLSVCSLPYTIYSLYYQKYKIRKWCPFCLLTLLMLWLSFVCYFSIITSTPFREIFSRETIYLFVLVFVIFICLWIFIKPYITTTYNNSSTEIELLRLKRSPIVFNIMMDNQRTFEMKFDENDIQLGNLSSSIIVTTLLSEKCTHCKRLVKSMLTHIQKDPSLKWIIRFNDLNIISQKDSLFSVHLYLLYQAEKDCFVFALCDWAHNMNYEEWVVKYPIRKLNEDYSLICRHKMEWMIKNNFHKMPMIFLNNKVLPEIYKLSDWEILLFNESFATAFMKT